MKKENISAFAKELEIKSDKKGFFSFLSIVLYVVRRLMRDFHVLKLFFESLGLSSTYISIFYRNEKMAKDKRLNIFCHFHL